MQQKETTPQQVKEAKKALTPHELYNYHIAHPNEPITEEDIRNLRLDSGAVSKEHQIDEAVFVPPYDEDGTDDKPISENNTSSSLVEEKPKTSPYDVLNISE